MKPMTPPKRIEALEKELARLLDWIKQSDTKSQMLIAINLAIITAVVGQTPHANKFHDWVFIFLLGGCALPIWNLYRCFKAVTPHVKGTAKTSLIFFGKIDELTDVEFSEAIKSRSEEDYEDDLIRQCKTNALIANKKYKRVKLAADITFWALPVALLAIMALFFDYYDKIRIHIWHL
jgi:hypothetical protein